MTVSVLPGSSTSGGRAILCKTLAWRSRRPPRLLVSVRNEREARVALTAGVDLVDVKEPRAGPLGMAPPEVIAGIAAVCRSRVPLSIAVGEIRQLGRLDDLPPGVGLLKAGPAGCASAADYFRHCDAKLPGELPRAAVAYADWPLAAAPSPASIAEEAMARGESWLLLDTFCKNGRSLFDHLSPVRLTRLAQQLHGGAVRLAVAGALRAGDARRAAACGADVIAFRTAACRAGRTSGLSFRKLQLLRALVHRHAAAQRADAVGVELPEE